MTRATQDKPAHIITHEGREYDLTKLETPLGLLPEPVQKALQAWPHGWEGYDCGWWDVFNLWDTSKACRAKPAPAETRVKCIRASFEHSDIDHLYETHEDGTCIKRPDGSIDWATWEPEA